MKFILDRKLYDTDKAQEIGSYERNHGSMDYIHETLYRSPKGVFFLVGEGGANTQYAEHLDNNMRGSGKGAHLIDMGEALDWCAMHDINIDIVGKYFDIEEG